MRNQYSGWLFDMVLGYHQDGASSVTNCFVQINVEITHTVSYLGVL